MAKMRNVVGWILLMFVLVDTKPTHHSNRLLRQIYSTAKELLKESKIMNNTFVDKVFDRKKCRCEDFCFAQKILLHALEKKHAKLTRALLVYTHKKTCEYTASGVTYPLLYLTSDVIHCAQQHLYHPNIQC